MTRATEPENRIIKYRISALDGTDIIEDSIKVNNPIYVDLIKGKTYKAVFFYSESSSDEKNVAIITGANMFRAQEVITVDRSLTETITLKRNIGQFVAKAGKMPNGATLEVDMTSYNHINWVDNALYSKTGREFTEVTGTLATDSTLSLFGLPNNEPKSVKVYVSIVKNGKPIKSDMYEYTLTPNTVRTVTYNINNVNEDGSEFGDFTIQIDEKWETGVDNNQQVGKPQTGNNKNPGNTGDEIHFDVNVDSWK